MAATGQRERAGVCGRVGVKGGGVAWQRDPQGEGGYNCAMFLPPSNSAERAALVKSFAREVGFDLVGISRPQVSPRADAYRAWLAAGKQGEMRYLGEHVEERLDPARKFPWARSIISLALAYWEEQPAAGPSADGGALGYGLISRYAWGRDYHRVMRKKFDALESRLRAAFGAEALQIRAYVDTGPLLERELAARAGLGWIGKHTLLIHPRHGSFFFLGELVTSLELAADSPIEDHCGSCTRCLEACPTAALTPYSLDAVKCISYQTLENRGGVPAEFHGPMRDAGFLIGCDLCQDVCPFNRAPLTTHEKDFAPDPPAPGVSLQQVLAWREQEWDILTRGRAHRRAKFPMWQRNARILLGDPAASSPAPA